MKIYPHYPKPVKNKVSQLMTYFKKSSSWLDSLYDRSYTMRMGEVKMPGLTLYIPNEPELVHRIMISEVKKFPKHPLQHQMLSPLLGNSIFTTNGKIWKKQREMLNPSFEMVRISNVFDLMNDAAKDMSKRLNKLSDGEYHNLDEEMTFVTADIIFRTIMSEKLSEEEGKKIVEAFVEFQDTSVKVVMRKIFLVSGFLNLFSNTEKIRKRTGKVIRDSLANIIQPRYDAISNNEEDSHRDILSFLLKVIDEDTNQPFSFKEILDQVSMLFLAGHETTASSMTWTLYLLGLYPEMQEQAYKEMLRHCATDEFTVENTKKLDFLTKIFKESLRLYPPVSFFPRTTVEETKMRDKKLPKGTSIVISPWLMHRNERYWEDPHMFNPKRFDEPKNIQKYTYFPFALGQRTCIGAGFAMQEAILLLATILREYKIELKPNFVPDIAGRLTTRSLNGMPIKLVKREKSVK
jgi:cytochrome P450